jgi:hypothetical protein
VELPQTIPSFFLLDAWSGAASDPSIFLSTCDPSPPRPFEDQRRGRRSNEPNLAPRPLRRAPLCRAWTPRVRVKLPSRTSESPLKDPSRRGADSNASRAGSAAAASSESQIRVIDWNSAADARLASPDAPVRQPPAGPAAGGPNAAAGRAGPEDAAARLMIDVSGCGERLSVCFRVPGLPPARRAGRGGRWGACAHGVDPMRPRVAAQASIRPWSNRWSNRSAPPLPNHGSGLCRPAEKAKRPAFDCVEYR